MQKHKIIALIVAIPVALFMWLYVVTTVTPETTKTISNVPVTIEGSIVLEERGLMLTSGSGTVNLEISGNRLSIDKLNSENIRVTADVSKITEAGDYSVDLSVSFPEMSGNGNFEILRKSITEITVSVCKIETKSVPVRIDCGDSVAKEGFYFDRSGALTDPQEITISGPDYEVSAVEEAIVDCSDIDVLEETVVESRPLYYVDAEGNRLSLSPLTSVRREEVTVTLPILKEKTVTLKVNLLEGGGATQDNASVTFAPTETILVRGTASLIDDLEDEFVIGEMDLSKISTSEARSFEIVLPTAIKNVSGVDEVSVTVRLSGLKRQSFFIDAADVSFINVPQNCEPALAEEKIAVVVRGPEDAVSKLQSSDIQVTVDLGSITQNGVVTAEAKVVSDNSVGVFGAVEVYVLLK